MLSLFSLPNKGIKTNTLPYTIIIISYKERDFSILTWKEKDNLWIKDHFFPPRQDIWLLYMNRLFLLFSSGSCLGKTSQVHRPEFGNYHSRLQSLSRQIKQKWFAFFVWIYGPVNPCKVIIWWKKKHQLIRIIAWKDNFKKALN